MFCDWTEDDIDRMAAERAWTPEVRKKPNLGFCCSGPFVAGECVLKSRSRTSDVIRAADIALSRDMMMRLKSFSCLVNCQRHPPSTILGGHSHGKLFI